MEENVKIESLEQLEEKVKASENDIIVGTGEFAKANGFIAYGPLVISMIQNAVREQWSVIKPLISAILQEKEARIKELEKKLELADFDKAWAVNDATSKLH